MPRDRPTSEKHIMEILEYAMLHGDAATMEQFNVNAETLGRYRRRCPDARLEALSKLAAKCSTEDLTALAAAGASPVHDVHVTSFDGEEFAFAHVTDPHMGSKFYHPEWWASMCAECKKQGVKTMELTGDITEGMSNRPGHIYELSQLGYRDMRDYAITQLELFDGDINAIDGNHDRWFQKSNGALIVEDICNAHPERWHYLGQDQGRHIVNGVEIELFHGEDGAAYAISYRVQKIVEAMTGGTKPRILLLGHDHKAIFLPHERNIACIGGGTMEAQTPWMRGKRIAAHCGFWIVRLVIRDADLKSITATFYPFFI